MLTTMSAFEMPLTAALQVGSGVYEKCVDPIESRDEEENVSPLCSLSWITFEDAECTGRAIEFGILPILADFLRAELNQHDYDYLIWCLHNVCQYASEQFSTEVTTEDLHALKFILRYQPAYVCKILSKIVNGENEQSIRTMENIGLLRDLIDIVADGQDAYPPIAALETLATLCQYCPMVAIREGVLLAILRLATNPDSQNVYASLVLNILTDLSHSYPRLIDEMANKDHSPYVMKLLKSGDKHTRGNAAKSLLIMADNKTLWRLLPRIVSPLFDLLGMDPDRFMLTYDDISAILDIVAAGKKADETHAVWNALEHNNTFILFKKFAMDRRVAWG